MFFGRMLRWGVALALIVLLTSPFAVDLYHRYEIHRDLARLANPAATSQSGALAAVNDDLLRHCQQIYGGGDPSCVRYRLALGD